MRILLLGGSGATGRWFARVASESGHAVTALVRAEASVQAHPQVLVVRGSVLDRDRLATVLDQQDAVVSCLGLRRAGRSPFAPLRSPPDLMTRVADSLVALMPRAGVRRAVVMSAGGVAESITQLSAPIRLLVRTGNVGVAYRDLAEMERIFSASRLDWLAVRPVTLMDGPPTGRAGKVDRYGLFSIVRRADVAAWMLGALARPTPYIDQTVLLATV